MLVPIQLDMMRPVTLIIVTQQHVMYPYLSPTETTDHEKIAFQHTRELFVDFENLIPEKVLVVSAVRSSYSHPDLLLIQQHPLFQITSVLNTGLSLSEPPQLYKGYNAISKAITGLICWLHVYRKGTTGHHCKIVQDSAR